MSENQENSQGLLIVIDGPAGAGKSTVAQAIANHYGLPVLDTGAIYRTLAWAAKQRGISWEDGRGLAEIAGDFPLRFVNVPGHGQRVFWGESDISAVIRTSEIAEGASKVSALPAVRDALLQLQRVLGAGGCVAEGRDMGTVVFPNAPNKFYLTASLETRAKRRLFDLNKLDSPEKMSLEQVQKDLERRDQRDRSRAIAPLARATDAILVDSDHLSFEEVVSMIIDNVTTTATHKD